MLNAADYFREASLSDGNEPDPRMADAIEMIRPLEPRMGRGSRPVANRGRVWFEVDTKAGGAVEVADFVRHPSARLVGSILPPSRFCITK